MANNNVVAKVVLIVGQAHAKAPNGTMRKLAVGDVIREGEQIVTSQGGRVELGFEDGSVRIARINEPVHPGSFETISADSDKKPAEQADDDASRVIDALAQGRNIDDLLQDPAAGLRSGGGRSDGGHAFVRLDRIVEPVSPIAFDFGTGDRTSELPIGGLGEDALPTNALPVAVADTNTVSELVDSTLPSTTSGNVLTSLNHGAGYADQADSDPEGDVLTVTQARFGSAAPVAAGAPMTLAYGTLVLNADGTYTYSVDNSNSTVNALNVGGVLTEVVTYTVSDGKGGNATTTLTITIGGVNDTPTAIIGAPITAPEDTESIVVPLRGTDPDSPLRSITVTTLPPTSQGKLFKPDGTPVVPGEPIPVGPDGSAQLVFVPAPNFNGTVDVPFTVTDNQGATSPGAVQQIIITPVNDGPLAVSDSASTPNGQPVTINVLGNDSDPDGDPLTVVGTPTASNGTVTVNPDGSLTYRPNPGFSGTETFTYTVVDPSGATSTATVTVNVAPPVNLAPIASPDAESTPAGVAITRNVLSNDTDPEGRPLGVTGFRVDTNGDGTPEVFLPGQTASIAGVGTLTVAANGVYTFTPAPGFTGPVPVVSYTVTDGTLSAGSTLTLSVSGGANIPPVATDNVNSVPINGSASGNVLTDGTPDSDVEGDPLMVTGFGIDTNGDGTPENFTPGQTATIPGVGTLTIGANGAYTFTPAANYAGPVPVASYTISDGNGGSDTATLTLTMGANNPPVATDDSAPVTEDTPVSGNVLTDGTPDSDPDGNPLTVTGFAIDTNGDGTPEAFTPGQTATIAGVGTLTIGADGAYTFTPTLNYTGPIPVASYTIGDGLGGTDTATLTLGPIGPVNDAPVATDNVNSVPINGSASGNVLTDGTPDSDVEGDPLMVTGFGIDTNGDGTPENFTPGQTATIPGVGTLTIGANGAYTFTPAANYAGPVPVASYTISDGNGGSDTATLTLTMGANNPPVATDDSAPVTEDTPVSGNVLTDGTPDSDPDGNPLTVTGFAIDTNGDGTPEAFTPGQTATIAGVGTLTIGADGAYTFTPTLNYTGPIPVASYTIGDGLGGTDTATLTLGPIGPVNDAPVATDNVNSVPINGSASGNVLTDGTPDSDVEGDPLMVTGFGIDTNGDGTPENFTPGQTATIPGVGTLTIGANGAYTFTPAANYAGPVPVASYTISDGNGGSDTATLTLTMGANNPPVATDDSAPVTEDTPVSGNVLTDGTPDSDPDGNPLTVTGFAIDTNGDGTPEAFTPGQTATIAGVGTLTIGADGAYTFTPTLNYTGPIPVASYTIGDGLGGTDTATLTLGPIGPVNDAPVATDNVNSVPINGSASGNVLTDGTPDSDVEGDPLMVTGFGIDTNGDGTPENFTPGQTATIPGVGTLTIGANGAYTFTPAANYAGPVPVASYTISDGNGGSDTATLTLTMGANNPPVATDDSAPVTEDTPVSGNVLTDGTPDSDPDGNPLTVTGFAIDTNGDGTPEAFTPGQTATIAGVGTLTIGADGAYTFTPTLNYTGPIPVASYTIGDGLGGTDTATLTLGPIGPVNDAPVATDNVNSVPINGSASGNVLTDGTPDSDVEGDPLMVTGFGIDTNGDGTPENFTPGQTATIPGVGTLTIGANGAYTFTPAANYAGPVPVASYTISDGNGGSDTATLTLTMGANNPPVATDDSAPVTEDTPVSGNVLTDGTPDSDPDGNPLTVTGFAIDTNGDGTPEAFTPGQTATIAGVGTLTIGADGAYTFTPTLNYTGPIPVASYTIGDGLGGTDTATLTLGPIGPVNDAPVDGDETNSVTEDTTLTVADGAAGDLLNNATDIDGGALSITGYSIAGISGTQAVGSAVAIPGVGSITINANGSYSFTPAANYTGAIPLITYTVSDGNGGTDTSTLQLSMVPVNDAPVDGDETNSVTEDTTLTVADGAAGDLLNNATDIDGGTLSITGYSIAGISGTQAVGSAVAIPGVGSITINANGSYSFTPAANYTGAIPLITYTVSDGNGGTDTSTLQLSMVPVNDAPVDGDETNSVTEDTTLTVADGAAGDLLNNATDIDGGTLSITGYSIAGISGTQAVGSAVAIPGVGSITINANGSYSFTPAANYTGAIPLITYTVSDGNGGTDTSTLQLSMVPVNDPPVAVTDNYSMAEDGTPITLAPLTGDSDPDGNPLTVSSINGTTLTPGVAQTIPVTNGTVNVSAAGVITFTPAANFNGTVSFPYVISDGQGGTATANQVITVTAVNDPPVDGNETNSVTEDTTLTVADGAAGDLLNNATDIDGGALSITGYSIAGISGTQAVGSAVAIPGVGSITINANGSYSFTPAANYTGAIPLITYTVSDGNGGTDTSTLQLSMVPVNDAPVATDNVNSVPINGSASGNVLTDGTPDSDVEGDPLTVTGFGIDTNGDGTPENFTPGQTATIPGVGTLTIGANGAYTFTPAANYAGPVPVASYTISDGNGGSDTATLTLTMGANNPPVATDDSAPVTEDTPVSGNVLTDGTPDSDPDGNPLTVTGFAIDTNGDGTPEAFTPGQTATIAGVGTLTIGADGAYTFTPTLNYTGPIPVASYTIGDGLGGTDTATLTLGPIGPVNDAPVDGDETNSVTEDTTLTVADGAAGDLLNNATDIDGGALSITGYSIAGISGTQAVGSAVAIPGVGSITINANGSYSFTPAANYTGAIPLITYTVSDGNGGTDTSTLQLSMVPVNDAPVDGDETNSVTEDTTLTVADGAAGDLLNNATDIDGGTLSITGYSIAGISGTQAVGSAVAIPGVGSITINANGSYSFTPAANYTGAIPLITYTVSDGNGGTDTSTLQLSMVPVNDAPVDGDETNSVTEDTTLTVADGAAGDLLNNATDIDGGTLSITGYSIAGISGTQAVGSAVAIPGVGSITINANGSYSFTPAANYTGAIPLITYTVSDGNGGTDTSTLQLSMVPVNDAPVDGDETNSVTEDTTLTVADGAAGDLLNNATDIDGGTLSITGYSIAGISGTQAVGSAVAIPGVGSITINANGSYSFTPAANYTGAIPLITYTVSDGNGGTDTSTLQLSMVPVNDPPVDGNETNSVTEDTTLTVADGAAGDLLNNATDIDGGALSITGYSIAGISGTQAVGSAVAIPGVGSITINANGSYSFTPAANYTGAIPLITYTVSDGNGGTDTSTLQLSMVPVNDPPVAVTDNYSMAEDGTPITLAPLTGDSDPDGNPLTVSSINGTTLTPGVAQTIPVTNGTVNVSAAGVITFTPAANFNGTVSFPYVISDGQGGTATANQVITVTAVNDPPVDGNETNSVTEDTTLTVADGAAGDLLNNATDIDGGALSITGYSIAGISGTQAVGSAVAIPGVGSITINANGSYSFTPAANYTGAIPLITYTVSDGNGGTDTSTLQLSMVPVNDAPVDGNETNSVTEDTTLTVADGAAGDLLNNATDIDGGALSITGYSIAGISGTQAVGSAVAIPGVGSITINANGSYSFTPAANYTGAIPLITYTVSDGNGGTDTSTLQLSMVPVNDAPVDGNETNSVTEDTTLTVADGAAGDLLNNATDIDGGTLSITGYSIAGISGTQAVGSAVAIPGVGSITINANGSYSFTPAANYTGAIPLITYTVSDGNGGTDTSTLQLSMVPVNDAPVDGDETNSVTEDTTLTVADGAAGDLLNNATDIDGGALSITGYSIAGISGTQAVGSAVAIPGVGSITINANGSYSFTPAANYTGAIPLITYTVSDGNGGTDTSTLQLSMVPVNDAPVDGDETNSVTEDTTLTVADGAAGDLLNNATDIDGGALSITGYSIAGISGTQAVGSAVAIPGVGSITINANGSYSFTPAANYTGAIPLITYTVSDGNGGTDTSTLQLSMVPVNDAPVDGDETNSVTEDTTLTVADGAAGDLLNNATDIDGGALSITGYSIAGISGTQAVGSAVAIPGVGSITINANGSYSFTPAANYTGAIPLITYTVSDGNGGTDTSTLQLSMVPVNDPPVAVTDNYSMAEDGTPITLAPLTGDSDPDGNPLTVSSINGTTLTPGVAQTIPVTNGTVNVSAAGVITFTPAANFNGTVSFPYVISDGQGGTATANQVITVTAVNDPPVAVTDNYSMAEDGTPITLAPLTGDSDPDGNPLTVSSINGTTLTPGVAQTIPVTNGTVNVSAAGVITFTPAANFNGTVSFPYVISDGQGGTATANQVITVTAVNDPPVAVTDNYSMAEDGTPITLAPLTGDSDPDGNPLTVSSINGTTLTPGVAQTIPVTNGTVNVSAAGVITFTPAANFNGTVSFPYVISDGQGGTATANQVITVTAVNDPPVDGNETNSVTEDTTLTVADGAAGDLLNNATDIDGGALSITGYSIAGISGTQAVGSAVAIPGVGSITINANGSYSFTPAANYTGAIPLITYTVSDGNGGTDTSTLQLSMVPVNDAPVDGDETNSVTEDTTLTVADGAAGDLLNNATDIDGGALSITGYSIAGISGTQAVGSAVAIPGVGSITINANGSYSFTPAANYTGAIPLITYTVSDGNGGTDTSTLQLSMVPVNDAPVDGDETNSVTEDTTLTVADGAAGDLLNNATDIDGGALSITGYSIAGISGTQAVGSAVAIPGVGSITINANGSYSFTPAANYTGAIPLITYTVSDGNGGTDTSTLQLSMVPVNDAPVDGDETNSVTEDTTLTVADGAAGDLLNNATDIDGGALSITGYSIAGISGTQAVGSAVAIPGVGSITINANGSYSFTPAANYTGAIPLITYTVSDGNGGTDTSTLQLSMVPVNDPPVAVTDNYSMAEDGTPITLAPLTGDSDPDGNPLTVSSINGTTLTPGVAQTIPVTNGTVNVSAAGVITFTPAANFNGTVSFPYVISDGQGGTATANQVITVTAVNDPPVAVTDNYSMAEDGTPITLAPLTGDSDPDGNPLTVSSINGTTLTPGVAQTIPVTNGTVNVSAAGVITFTPAANFNGTVSFPYVISDGQGGTATANQVITVTAVNDPPVAVTDNYSMAEDGTPITLAPLTGDSDPDGNPLTVSSINGTTLTPGVAQTIPVTNGTVNVSAAGVITFTPAANFNGTVSFPYVISDGQGGTATANQVITVTAVNDPPVDGNETNSVTEDTTLTVADGAAGDLLNNATDIDGGALSITGYSIAGISGTQAVGSAVAIPGVGSITINANGSYSFTPAANYTGAIPLITYTVSDGNGGTDTSTLQLSMVPVNDPPVAVTDNYSMAEDGTPITLAPLTGDSDPDGNPLTVSSINGTTLTPGVAQTIPVTNGTVNVSAAGVITFTPAANFNGTVSFPYVISDGQGGTATANQVITVTAVNDPPVAVTDNYSMAEDGTPITLAPLTGDSDPDGNPLTVSSINGTTLTPGVAQTIPVTNGTVNVSAAGVITFTPAANFNGTVSFPYVISDGQGGTATANQVITVTAVNDPPVAVTDNYSMAEDGTPITLAPLTGDSDPDGNPLTVSSINGTTLTPGVAQTIPVTNGTVNVSAAGVITFTPAANFNGTVSFPYVISDGQGGTATANQVITVTAVNDPPVDGNETNSVTEDTTLTVADGAAGDLLNNATDIDGGALSITGYSIAGISGTQAVGSAVAIPGVGSITINANGSYSFTPAANYTGAIPLITYTVSDGNGGTDTSTLQLSMVPVNDAPTAAPVSQVGTEDSSLTIGWSAFGAADVETAASGLSIRIMTLPSDGVLRLNGVAVTAGQVISNADITAGRLVFTPDTNESGYDGFGTSGTGNLRQDYAAFDYQVFDGSSNSATATLRVDVTPVADSPNLVVTNTVASSVFANSWETAANSDTTSQGVAGPTLEGWTLVTSPDSQAGGVNAFEIWAEGDYQQRQDGGFDPVLADTGNGTQYLELNNGTSTTLPQTLGISRSVTTVAGMVYELSFDYAGRQGFGVDFTRIGVYVDGVLVTQYSASSPQDYIDWRNLKLSFLGDGGTHTVLIRTDATQFVGAGRGAFIDDLSMTGYQGVIAGNIGGGQTGVLLASYVSASLVDADSSESLTLTFFGVPAGARIVTASNPTGIFESGGSITISGSDLASAQLRFGSAFSGDLAIGVTATSTEPNATNATSSATLNLKVLASGLTVDDPGLSITGSGTITGGADNDRLAGGAAADNISGGGGDDVIIGGAGGDTLSGGAGIDVFRWVLGNQGPGTGASAPNDRITDFSTNSSATGGDILDLRDLLQGENHNTGIGNLLRYIDVTVSGADTVLRISSAGGYNTAGDYAAAQHNQTITLQGVNLFTALGAANETAVIQELLNRQKLIVD